MPAQQLFGVQKQVSSSAPSWMEGKAIKCRPFVLILLFSDYIIHLQVNIRE